MRDELLKASRLHFRAHVEKHRVNVENLLRNSQGVADQPDIMDTIEKELEEIVKYNDLIVVLDKYFNLEPIKKPKELLTNEIS